MRRLLLLAIVVLLGIVAIDLLLGGRADRPPETAFDLSHDHPSGAVPSGGSPSAPLSGLPTPSSAHEMPSAPAASDGDLDVVTLTVEVMPADGGPMTATAVVLTQELILPYGPPEGLVLTIASVHTDENNRAVFRNLTPGGTYLVHADGPSGWRNLEFRAERVVAVARDMESTLLVVRAPSITGLCLDHENAPLSGALLQLRLESVDGIVDPAYKTTSGEDGRFLLAGISAEIGTRGYLRASHPRYVDDSYQEVPIDGRPAVIDPIVFVNTGTTLTGIIMSDDTETPIHGATVLLRSSTHADVTWETTTDDDGSFAIPNLGPGTHVLEVKDFCLVDPAPGRIVILEGPCLHDAGVVHVRRGPHLFRVLVVDPFGTPVPDVRVILPSVGSRTTNGAGRVTFACCSEGPFDVRLLHHQTAARGADYSNLHRGIRADGVERELVLRPSGLLLRFVDVASREPVAPESVTVALAVDDRRERIVQLERPGIALRVNGPLRQGSYTVAVLADGFAPHFTSMDIAEDVSAVEIACTIELGRVEIP